MVSLALSMNRSRGRGPRVNRVGEIRGRGPVNPCVARGVECVMSTDRVSTQCFLEITFTIAVGIRRMNIG